MNIVEKYMHADPDSIQAGSLIRVLELPDTGYRPSHLRYLDQDGVYQVDRIVECASFLTCRANCTTNCKAYIVLDENRSPVNTCNYKLGKENGIPFNFGDNLEDV